MQETSETAPRLCRQCKLEIPETARTCGHCGRDQIGPAEQVFRLVLGAALGLVIVFVGLLVLAFLRA